MAPAPQSRSCSLSTPLRCSTTTCAPAGRTRATSRPPRRRRKWWGHRYLKLDTECYLTREWARFVCLFALSERVDVGWSRLPGPQNILHVLHGERQTQTLHVLQPCSFNIYTCLYTFSFLDKETNENEPLLLLRRLCCEARPPLGLDQRLHRYEEYKRLWGRCSLKDFGQPVKRLVGSKSLM